MGIPGQLPSALVRFPDAGVARGAAPDLPLQTHGVYDVLGG